MSNPTPGQRKRFLERHSAPPGFSHFEWLGAGGGGAACAWSKGDENGRVVDKVAVKDSYMDNEHWALWWWRMPDSSQPWNWIPNEVDAMANMSCDKIVSLRSSEVYHAKQMYRIYMEYCPGGDLRQLIKDLQPRPPNDLEPFVWWCLQCFTEAALVMLQGDLTTVTRDWQYIHNDLKAHNIFLGYRDRNDFPAYPVPKTGDFGHACRTSPTDDRNPEGIMRRGTRGWRSPEMELLHAKLLSPSDVWVYGAICMSIMELDNDTPGKISFDDDAQSEEYRTPTFLDETYIRSKYSDELVDLVLECVDWFPEKRPKLTTMRETILRHTGGRLSATGNAQPDLAKGMRRKAFEDVDEGMLVGSVHMSFAERDEAPTEAGHEEGGQDVEMADEPIEGDVEEQQGDVEMAEATRGGRAVGTRESPSRRAVQGAQREHGHGNEELNIDDDSDYEPEEDDDDEEDIDSDSDYVD